MERGNTVEMKSTPIEDLLEGESVTDEDEMERDISSISEDIRKSNAAYDEAGASFQNEILSMRSQLEELKRLQNGGTAAQTSTSQSSVQTTAPTTVKASAPSSRVEEVVEGNILDEIFRYKRTDDVIEIVSLITVYVIFTLNAFVDFVDNCIPFMFYQYNALIKGVLFVIVYRGIQFFLKKLFKANQ